jgi:hypothetical protein
MWGFAITYSLHNVILWMFYTIQLKIITNNKSKDNLITILWKVTSTALSHLSHYLQIDILDNLLSHTHMIHMWGKEYREWWGRLYSFQCQLSSTNKQKKHFKNETIEDVKYVNASQILHSYGGCCIIPDEWTTCLHCCKSQKNLHAWMPVSVVVSYLEFWLPILTGLFIIFLSSSR